MDTNTEKQQNTVPEKTKLRFRYRDMQPWQRHRLYGFVIGILLFSVLYLSLTCSILYKDKTSEQDWWVSSLQPDQEATDRIKEISENAIHVTTGTYVDNLREINVKGSYYRVEFNVWFRWDGDPDLDMAHNFHVYKGVQNKLEVMEDYHKDGVNYQICRCDYSVSKNYWTRRFPLESHQLRFYIESNYSADTVVLDCDEKNSGYNRDMSISGYEFVRHAVGEYAHLYDNNRSNPRFERGRVNSEIVTAMEIKRNTWGLYVKCFIALVGTITWVFIVLFINTNHRVDPLSMIPAALFGTVTNMAVGANLLPDALQTGLLEFVNFWGIFSIIAVAIVVINVNRIRNKYEDRAFAKYFGRVMFTELLTVVIIGHILLAISAYMF